MKHIVGKNYTTADGLSRRGATDEEREADLAEQDIEDFIDSELISVGVFANTIEKVEPALENGYDEDSIVIANYLTTLTKPTDMNQKDFRKLKNKALQFRVQDRQLFKRNSRNVPSRRVIDNSNDQQRI